MRHMICCVAAAVLLALVACNQTVGDCYPRGQGDGTIGAGAGVITSGGVGASGEGPPEQPQDVKYPEEACNAPADDGTEEGTYIRCRGLHPTACAAECNAIGAYCVEHAAHPQNPSVGIGDLKQCMETLMSYTCTYCYSNGDVCTYICALKGCGLGNCTNTGGKGCE